MSNNEPSPLPAEDDVVSAETRAAEEAELLEASATEEPLSMGIKEAFDALCLAHIARGDDVSRCYLERLHEYDTGVMYPYVRIFVNANTWTDMHIDEAEEFLRTAETVISRFERAPEEIVPTVANEDNENAEDAVVLVRLRNAEG
ncbi:hypothetical protein ACIP5N_27600 [Streptomyces sp. NPDC088768]|uniref:hypothetical protein n=1 Tax=Streptomyces sp. NPDC088768 TaxID=3365894 RepID=UPI003807FC30